MRIISNEKTDDCSSYLERKKGIVILSSILTKNPKNYNNSTNNFKINNKHNIVKSNSYNKLNNIKNVERYFKCNPNNNKSKTTINLNNGEISIFDYNNTINNKKIIENNNIFFNNTDTSNCYLNNFNIFNNFTYILKNNYVSDECILKYLLKNINKLTHPTLITINSINYNKITDINGENTNAFIDQENILHFDNLKKYNYSVFFGFTLSGQSMPLDNIKQYDRLNLDISSIFIEYETHKLFQSSWSINNINSYLINSLQNFNISNNEIIYPEYNYEIYNYHMRVDSGLKSRKKGIIENINYVDFSFITPPPTRTDVNPNNYNILLEDISNAIETNNINVLGADFSYYLIQDFSGEYYNTFIGPALDQIDNKLTFNINKNYKLFVGNTKDLDETKKGVDLSGLLCDFSFSIIQPDSSIYNSYSIDISSLNGYDNSFNILPNLSKSNQYFDISISNAIDIAHDSYDQKIKNYYLGVDISNILVKDISINELITTQVSDISKIFELQIDQLFFKHGEISRKNLKFYYLQEPNKTNINGTIDISKIRYFNPDNMNYFFGINYININNIQLEIIYDISLSSFDASYLVNDVLGYIDISINFSLFTWNLSELENLNNLDIITIKHPQKYQNIINISYNEIFNLSHSNSLDNINLDFYYNLNYHIDISFLNNPFYNFNNISKNGTHYVNGILFPQNSYPIEKFKEIFNINFREEFNNDFNNDLSSALILYQPGNFNPTLNNNFVNWDNFQYPYDHTIKLKEGQLLWNIQENAFTTRDIIDNYPYIDYSIYIDNSENDLTPLANSGNNIHAKNIDIYWNIDEQLTSTQIIKSPLITKQYKFITLKININFNKLYESNIILVNVYELKNNIYKRLILNNDFIMYVCEENNFYNTNNSGYNGRTGWMNASKIYNSTTHNRSIQSGGGCYSNIAQYYYPKDPYDYELLIPHLNSKSTTAIYLKIGLAYDSYDNIAKVNYRLPNIINN